MTTNKVLNPSALCNLKFDNEGLKFSGYASVFNSNDLVNDTILKGAFKEYEGVKLSLFVNHKHDDVPVGSFVGKEDEKGFYIEAEINPDHKDAKTIYSALKRGDITGLSIGFGLTAGSFEVKDDGGRIIKSVVLKETSIVTFPCEPKARVEIVKSFDEVKTIRDLEKAIREEFRLSRPAACYFLSQVKQVLTGDPVNIAEQIRELKTTVLTRDSSQNIKSYLESMEF